MLNRIARRSIEKFETHYAYDASYLKELLNLSPKGFRKFSRFQPMSQHRESVPIDAYFVAYLTATRSEDCSSCVQLVTRMAIEAGVPRDIAQAAANGSDDLPESLRVTRNYAYNVCHQKTIEPELIDAMHELYGAQATAELALAIASARVFPTLKRGLGFAKSCSYEPALV